MILENAVLTDNDKMKLKNILNRLEKGILNKIPQTMDIETGVRNLFMRYDKDKTGKMTIDELNRFCLGIGVPLERK